MIESVLIPIYEINLHLFVEEEIDDLMLFHCPDECYDDGKLCKATTIPKKRNIFVFIREKYLNHNTIAHELDHVTHMLMRDIGMSESEDSEEAYAYLTGWLHGWTYETLRDKGARVYFQDKKEPKI